MRTISLRNPLQKWSAQSSLVCVCVPTTTYRHHHIQAPPHNHHHTVQVAQVQLEHLHHWLEGKHHQLKLLKLIRGDQAPASIGSSWSRMQQKHATCTWAQLACKCPCASCMYLLHPAPTCADGCRWRSAAGEPQSFTYLLQQLSVAIQMRNSSSVMGTLELPGLQFSD